MPDCLDSNPIPAIYWFADLQEILASLGPHFLISKIWVLLVLTQRLQYVRCGIGHEG